MELLTLTLIPMPVPMGLISLSPGHSGVKGRLETSVCAVRCRWPRQVGAPAECPRSRRHLFPMALCTEAEALSSVGLQEGSIPGPCDLLLTLSHSCQPDLPDSFHSSMILPNGQECPENQAVIKPELGGRRIINSSFIPHELATCLVPATHRASWVCVRPDRRLRVPQLLL